MTEETTQEYSCEVCGVTSTDEDDFNTHSRTLDRLCHECGLYCERCEDIFYSDERNCVGDDIWCDNCASNYSFYCDGCEERYDSDRIDSYYIHDIRSYRCHYCTENNYNWCESCEHYYDNNCACDDSVIHSYGYKPEPIFHGHSSNNLYFGIELETEVHGDLREAAKKAKDLEEHYYLKQDSSIGRNGASGFEIVTHPATYDYYRNEFSNLWDFVEDIRKNDHARSWDTDTCGLHIHISRKGFSSGAHTHRFLAFIYRNAKDMIKFAGRSSDYAKFSDCWKFDEYAQPYLSFKDKIMSGRNTERYSAVNTQNRDTLELRFFRGTMRKSGVMSAIELAHASVEYTRHLTVSDIRYGAYNWTWFADWVRDQNIMFGIYSDLLARMAKCPTVNINKIEVIEA